MRWKREFKTVQGAPPVNPGLVDKDLVKRMCEKSLRLYRSKWRWRKLCAKAYCTPEELEKRFDTVIEKQDKLFQQIKEQRENEQTNTDQQLGTDARRESGDGSEEKKQTISGDARQPEGKDNTGKRKKVRQRKTNDESVTTGGSE